MNIIDALKSGKKFRRKGWSYFIDVEEFESFFYRSEDILADDWEVEEKKITLTESLLEKACHNAAGNTHLDIGPFSFDCFIEALKKELGL